MLNRRMEEKLDKNECLDVRKIGVQIGPGVFRLNEFVEGVDYADVQNEAWIWSIGRDKKTGEIRASTSSGYYLNPDYECLWLR
jgi:hypothetical protein